MPSGTPVIVYCSVVLAVVRPDVAATGVTISGGVAARRTPYVRSAALAGSVIVPVTIIVEDERG